MKLMPFRPVEENAPLPVKYIKPPKTKEPAEIQTIATVLLRRNKKLFESKYSPEGVTCMGLFYRTQERQLTEEEAHKALALIAVLKGRKR
jgi:hypothetical protein